MARRALFTPETFQSRGAEAVSVTSKDLIEYLPALTDLLAQAMATGDKDDTPPLKICLMRFDPQAKSNDAPALGWNFSRSTADHPVDVITVLTAVDMTAFRTLVPTWVAAQPTTLAQWTIPLNANLDLTGKELSVGLDDSVLCVIKFVATKEVLPADQQKSTFQVVIDKTTKNIISDRQQAQLVKDQSPLVPAGTPGDDD